MTPKKTTHIAVIGMGYVGIPIAALLANVLDMMLRESRGDRKDLSIR
jgi:NADH dehydrogenase FAD-containing subunit